MKRWGFAAVVAAGVLLAGCASQAEPAPPSSTTVQVAAVTSTAAKPAAPKWSAEAVTACRTFVNAVPNMRMLKNQIQRTDAGITDAEVTGWGLATAGMTLPANLAVAAEPEVHDAMQAVAAALDTEPVNRDFSANPDYAKVNAEAFSGAIQVCNRVGVIA